MSKPQYLMYKKGLIEDYRTLHNFKFLIDAGCITTFNIEYIEYACQGWLECSGPPIPETDRKWFARERFVSSLLKWCEEQKLLTGELNG